MSDFGRVVLDTSTLVSAALRVGSVPHRVLVQALQIAEVCVCAATLAELDEVLMRPKFDRYQTAEIRQDFLAFIHQRASMFEVSEPDVTGVHPPCRDPKDNPFLALAQRCAARYLVSSDADLLVLHPWNGVHIVAPASFLALVQLH